VASALPASASHAHAQGLPFHTPSALTTSFEQRGVRAVTTLGRTGAVRAWTTRLTVLPWAPSARFTTSVSLPITRKRLDGDPGRPRTISGLGDLSLSGKWAVFVRNRPGGTSRVAVIGSVRLPTGSTDAVDDGGRTLPRPLQPGAGSPALSGWLTGTLIRDRWGVTAAFGPEWATDNGSFDPGVTLRYGLALGVRFPAHVADIRTRTVQVYLEWNGTQRTRSREAGLVLADTGGHLAFVSPGVQWVLLPRLLVEASVQVPVLRRLHGNQPDPQARSSFGLRYLF